MKNSIQDSQQSWKNLNWNGNGGNHFGFLSEKRHPWNVTMKCIFRKKKEDFTVIDIRYLEHSLIDRLRNLIKYCTGGLLHGAILKNLNFRRDNQAANIRNPHFFVLFLGGVFCSVSGRSINSKKQQDSRL